MLPHKPQRFGILTLSCGKTEGPLGRLEKVGSLNFCQFSNLSKMQKSFFSGFWLPDQENDLFEQS